MFKGRTFIIAEAGVNHNGDSLQALELVRVAALAGVDAVKFQSFKADRLSTATAKKAAYQEVALGAKQSQYEMLRALELNEASELAIAEECRKQSIVFMSTPFDESSADFLVKQAGMNIVKVGSGELTNAPLLLHIARLGKKVILSTGMASMDEIAEALSVLVFGFREAARRPDISEIEKIKRVADFASLSGHVSLLHCTTEYPAPIEELNLRAIPTMRDAFRLPVGYSDHSIGITIPPVAVAIGAEIIEKHFTLDRAQVGPDHRASLEPSELIAMVRAIRDVEKALGTGSKVPTESELRNREIARRSIVAANQIAKGEVFTESNLTTKRPGSGLRPIELWNLIGRKSARDYDADEAID
ncbi:MAG: N-acetylneuraminate synthase [Xanthobacteraceae bacterium]|nr:N-acetylneuraminate synthase [Xanthobacteraceae bacterium]